MDRAIVVYTTFPDEAVGRSIARALVERKLAACVNLIPGMQSVYAWKGAVEEAQEVVGIVKTRAALAEAVRAAIVDLHPYETPVVLLLPVEGGDPQTLAWIAAETGDGDIGER